MEKRQDIYKLRKKLKLSQIYVADLLEVSPRYYRDYEKGKIEPSEDFQARIDIVFNYLSKKDFDMTVQLDYLRVQFKTLDHTHILENIIGIKEGFFLSEVNHTYGYSMRYSLDQIWLFKADKDTIEMGCLIQLGGQGCSQFEQFLKKQGRNWFDFLALCLDEGGKFTRIDIAINDYEEYFKMSELLYKLQNNECISKFRTFKILGESDFDTGERSGLTIYLGSQSSEIYFCFYQKNYEIAKKKKIPIEEIDIKNRYEIRYSQSQAHHTGIELVKTGDLMGIAKGTLSRYLRFIKPDIKTRRTNCPTWQPWQDFIEGATYVKMDREEPGNLYDRALGWLQYSVAPTLKMIDIIDKNLQVSELADMIQEAELKEKHEHIIKIQTTEIEDMITDLR